PPRPPIFFATHLLPTAGMRVISCASGSGGPDDPRCAEDSFRRLSSFRSAVLGAHLGFGGAVGVAVDGDDLDAVATAIDHSGDASSPFDGLSPLREGLVGGDHDGGWCLVAARRDLVHEVGEVTIVAQVAQFVDDEELGSRIAFE